MPITFVNPPEAVTELTRNKIQDIARQGHFHIHALAAANPTDIGLSSGHPVYNLGLKEIVDGASLDQLPITAWRFIVQSPNAEATAAETLSSGASGTAEFSSVNSGPFASGTTEAFTALMQDPRFATGDWEARLLRIPALYIFAVWAHEKQSGSDLLKAVQPAPAYLDPSKIYTWQEFLTAIKPAAEQRLTADAAGKG